MQRGKHCSGDGDGDGVEGWWHGYGDGSSGVRSGVQLTATTPYEKKKGLWIHLGSG